MYLEANNIVKKYYHHLALDHVSIAVEQGSVFGLLGPNGAGKSTLIRIINRITAADEGEVTLLGKPITDRDVARIGYLPEERGLYRKMKVGEQAIYLARLKGMSKADAVKNLKQWFEKFDIMPWWNRKVEELSKGMQQKIQFVCTVIHQPELLIFDEPFSGFDPVNAELLKREILTLRDQGCTVIFSTHNMNSVEELCNQIALIDKSKVALRGDVQDIKQRYAQDIVALKIASTQPLAPELLSQLEVVDQKMLSSHSLELSVRSPFGSDVKPILEALPQGTVVLELQQKLPSMNEIFIEVVKNIDTDSSSNPANDSNHE